MDEHDSALSGDDLLEADLDDYLGAPVPTGAVHHPGAEVPLPDNVLPAPDEDYADKLLWRARRLRSERNHIDALARRRIDEIERWRADRLKGIEHEQGRVRQALDLFMRRWHLDNPRRPKTLKLTNGSLSLKAPSQGRLIIEDEPAFVAWAKGHKVEELLRYKPEPSKSALRELERHPAPQTTIEGEMHNTWRVITTVMVGDEDGREAPHPERATVPGVRFVQRVEDRFGYETVDDGTPSEEGNPAQ